MRRALRFAAVTAWVLALAPMVPSTMGAAEGAVLDAYGWWNRNQALPVQGDPTGLGLTTVPTVPAPATVPEDGLYVASDGGASAISAVRYRLDGQAGGTLTLSLAEGVALTGTEAVVACPVQGGFQSAQNGRWDSAPAYDPASCTIPGEPNEAGDALTFAIPSTFASALGDIGAVIAPAADATPFSLAFDKPANESFVVTTEVVSTPSATPSAAPAYEPGSAVFSAPVTDSPSFSTPSAPAVAAPETSGEDEVAAGAPAPVSTVPAAATTDESRTAQILAVTTLLAIGAALWRLANQPQRAPRLLGSVGGAAAAAAATAAPVVATSDRPRGVGRFARARTAPPTAI